MKRKIKKTLRKLGYALVRYSSPAATSEFDSLRDFTAEEKKIFARAKPFTMTSSDRMAALVNAVKYLTDNKIAGDIAECGVWRGGSMMTVALALLEAGDRSRSLYLYDTYEGMSEPTEHDTMHNGTVATDMYKEFAGENKKWCYASLEDVRENILSTGYPAEKVHLIKGKVEDTIPQHLPGKLALLRLDTDWYESTRHELLHLYPLLQNNGVLVIDDYGCWAGAKKAVDEYFAKSASPIFLHRIDNTGRMLIKSGV